MSVCFLSSHKQSAERNFKTFASLQERSIFTYQDEAGLHLCVVKGRVNERLIQILLISDVSNMSALLNCTATTPELYHYNKDHYVNILNVTTNRPSKEQLEKTRIRSELELYYNENVDSIWSHPKKRNYGDVMLHFENDKVVLTFFDLNSKNWPNWDKIFIIRSIYDSCTCNCT